MASGVMTALLSFTMPSFTSATTLPFAVKFDGRVTLKSFAISALSVLTSKISIFAVPFGLPPLSTIFATAEILPCA